MITHEELHSKIFSDLHMDIYDSMQYLTMEGCVTFIYVEEHCFNHVKMY